MLLRPFPELEHLGKFVGGVDVEDRERHPAEKRFSRQPDEHVRIFSHRPGHGNVLERVIRLAKNENTLVLEFVEMSALGCLLHRFCRWGRFTEPPATRVMTITERAIEVNGARTNLN